MREIKVSAGTCPSGGTPIVRSGAGQRICAFEKFLQDLSYDQLADAIAELGHVIHGIVALLHDDRDGVPDARLSFPDDPPAPPDALAPRPRSGRTPALESC